jgi:hypothetical protein
MVGMFHIAIRNPATEKVGRLMVIYRLDINSTRFKYYGLQSITICILANIL